MAISIELILKNLGLIQSAKQSSEAVAEVADTLDEIGEAGDEATTTAKNALEDLRRAAMDHVRTMAQTFGEMTEAEQDEFRKRYDNAEDLQTAIADLDRQRAEAAKRVNQDYTAEYERVFGKMETTAEDASKSVGDSTEKGFERAGDAAKDAGQTVTDELGGALSDIDGTAQGAADGALSALRGLSALIPGVGAAIGAGLAVAGSIFIKGFFDDIEAAESRVDSMADHFIKSTTRMLTEKSLIDVYDQWFNDDEMSERAQKVADAAGLPLHTVLVEMAKNGQGMQDIIGEVQTKLETLIDAGANTNQMAPLKEARDILQDTQREWEAARSKADIYARGLDEILNSTVDLQTAAETTTTRLDRMAAPRTVDVTLNVDTAEAERKVSDWQAKQRTIRVGIGVADGTRYIS